MSDNPLADEVWRRMAAFVMDNRDSWKRAVVEQAGMPFSRIRILKRLDRQPMPRECGMGGRIAVRHADRLLSRYFTSASS